MTKILAAMTAIGLAAAPAVAQDASTGLDAALEAVSGVTTTSPELPSQAADPARDALATAAALTAAKDAIAAGAARAAGAAQAAGAAAAGAAADAMRKAVQDVVDAAKAARDAASGQAAADAARNAAAGARDIGTGASGGRP